jgi:hypothetical protein
MNSYFPTLVFYIWPVLAQVGLTYTVAALILSTRLSDLFFGSGTARFYESYAGFGGPPLVQRTTSQLGNLFEFPVLFFALISLLVAVNFADPLMKLGACIFVGGRWVHALVHLFANKLWIRTPVFMVSNLVLFAMWGRLGYLTLLHS